MHAGLLNSRIQGAQFTTSAMCDLWSDVATLKHYTAIELALATTEAKLGIIPAHVPAVLHERATSIEWDFDKLSAETYNVGVPIVPFLAQLKKHCGPEGKYLHYGATTQDIMDTAVVLQIKASLDLLETDLSACINELKQLAKTHRDTAMPGRTHLQQALPVSFGYKCAVYLSMLLRHQARLEELKPRVLVGQFAGAAGTLASLGTQGLEVQKALMQELDLGVPEMTWHTARDSLCEVVNWCAMLTASLAKFAQDLVILMSNEVGEVLEPYLPGRGASSTMPQKRNPMSSEVILANARHVRQAAALCMEAAVQDFERATGPWMSEWTAIPDAFMYTAGSLAQAKFLLSGLEVKTERMRENLAASGGLIVAEAVMMALAPSMGRDHAHHVVADACKQALAKVQTLESVLLTIPEVTAALNHEQIKYSCDPANYLGLAPVMVDRLLSA